MADKKNKNRKNLWEKIKNNPFPVIFIISLIAFIFKYKGFPRADANAQLVGIYHAANPEYFKNDFYANSFSSFDVTTSFTKLVNLVNTPINNYEITYMLLLFASMFVFSIGFYKIVFLLTKNRELSLFSIILPLSVYTMRIGIGNTFEIGNCLIPANIAWAIAIWPLYFYLKEKYSLSFFLLGLASIFHVLIGILLFGAFFFNLLLNKKYKSIFSSLYFFILFAVTAIPLFISNAKTSSQDPAKIISALGFRSPWHYLPSTWPLPDWITFFSFFIFFLIIFYKFSKIDKEYKKIFEGFLIIILVYYLIGTIFVELIPLKFIIKLQLFRITKLLNIIELIFVGIFFYNYIYKKFPKKIKIFLIFLVCSASLIYLFFNPLLSRYEFDKDTAEMYDFIKTSTPEDSVFLAPLHMLSFRIGTMRAIVIDFKGVPFGEKFIVEWYNRLVDVTNNFGGNSNFYHSEEYELFLRKGYNSLTAEDVRNLQNKYSFSYAVFEKPSDLEFSKHFENGKYVVYKI